MRHIHWILILLLSLTLACSKKVKETDHIPDREMLVGDWIVSTTTGGQTVNNKGIKYHFKQNGLSDVDLGSQTKDGKWSLTPDGKYLSIVVSGKLTERYQVLSFDNKDILLEGNMHPTNDVKITLSRP